MYSLAPNLCQKTSFVALRSASWCMPGQLFPLGKWKVLPESPARCAAVGAEGEVGARALCVRLFSSMAVIVIAIVFCLKQSSSFRLCAFSLPVSSPESWPYNQNT